MQRSFKNMKVWYCDNVINNHSTRIDELLFSNTEKSRKTQLNDIVTIVIVTRMPPLHDVWHFHFESFMKTSPLFLLSVEMIVRLSCLLPVTIRKASHVCSCCKSTLDLKPGFAFEAWTTRHHCMLLIFNCWRSSEVCGTSAQRRANGGQVHHKGCVLVTPVRIYYCVTWASGTDVTHWAQLVQN